MQGSAAGLALAALAPALAPASAGAAGPSTGASCAPAAYDGSGARSVGVFGASIAFGTPGGFDAPAAGDLTFLCDCVLMISVHVCADPSGACCCT